MSSALDASSGPLRLGPGPLSAELAAERLALRRTVAGDIIGVPDDVLDALIVGVLLGGGSAVLLRGPCGIGKTSLAARLATILGAAFEKYDATKDDLITVGGIPSVTDGVLRFAEHERAVWNKEIVLIDEIGRAQPETANFFQELLEGSFFGRRLPRLRAVLATANPPEAGYGASFELDLALLDRFFVVLDVPDHRDAPRALLCEQARSNLDRLAARSEQRPTPAVAASAVANLVRRRDELLADPTVRSTAALVSAVIASELRGSDRYLSPRTYANYMPRLFVDFLAYLEPIEPRAAFEAARRTTKFGIGNKLEIDAASQSRALRAALPMVQDLDRRRGRLGRCYEVLGATSNDAIEACIARLSELLAESTTPEDEERLAVTAIALTREACEALREDVRATIVASKTDRAALERLDGLLDRPEPTHGLHGALQRRAADPRYRSCLEWIETETLFARLEIIDDALRGRRTQSPRVREQRWRAFGESCLDRERGDGEHG